MLCAQPLWSGQFRKQTTWIRAINLDQKRFLSDPSNSFINVGTSDRGMGGNESFPVHFMFHVSRILSFGS
jgi:hypothetical protein